MATNFPTSLDVFTTLYDNTDRIDAAHINNIQDAVEALEAKIGVDGSSVDTSLDYKIKNFWDEDTRIIYFHENTAPMLWSTTGLPTDCVLAIKGGSQDYNVDGGTNPGSWTIDTCGSDSHVHIWSLWDTDDNMYVYNSSGTKTDMFSFPSQKGSGVVWNVQKADPKQMWYPDGARYTSTDSHSHSHDGTWRPPGALGILAMYTG